MQLKQQLEGALQEAEAALAALGDAAHAAGAAPSAEPMPAPATQLQADISEKTGAATAAEAAAEGPALRPAAGSASQPRAAPARGNARIHPRSRYAHEEPDFAALARLYPSLQPFLLQPRGGGAAHAPGAAAADADAATDGAEAAPAAAGADRGPLSGGQAAAAGAARASLDFTDATACRELTRVLLRHDFGLEWWVPLGQLVPPVTNRANYIHWLEDLLSLSGPKGELRGARAAAARGGACVPAGCQLAWLSAAVCSRPGSPAAGAD